MSVVSIFSVDYLLPVRIGRNWIGIVYRNGQCAMALMDRYDIVNKAILCNPSFDTHNIRWFQNEYNRLKIVPDQYGAPARNSMPSTSASIMQPRPMSVSPSTDLRHAAVTRTHSVTAMPSIPHQSAPSAFAMTSRVPTIPTLPAAVGNMPMNMGPQRLMDWMDRLIYTVRGNAQFYAQFINIAKRQ